MARFKVIVCSNCKRARGVRKDSKKVKCNRCGTTIDVEQARAYFTTDSERELAKAVGDMNARLSGKDGLVHDGPGPEAGYTSRARDERALVGFVEGREDFTLEQAMRSLSEARGVPFDKVTEEEVLLLLDVLKQKGLIIEQRDGYFVRV